MAFAAPKTQQKLQITTSFRHHIFQRSSYEQDQVQC